MEIFKDRSLEGIALSGITHRSRRRKAVVLGYTRGYEWRARLRPGRAREFFDLDF